MSTCNNCNNFECTPLHPTAFEGQRVYALSAAHANVMRDIGVYAYLTTPQSIATVAAKYTRTGPPGTEDLREIFKTKQWHLFYGYLRYCRETSEKPNKYLSDRLFLQNDDEIPPMEILIVILCTVNPTRQLTVMDLYRLIVYVYNVTLGSYAQVIAIFKLFQVAGCDNQYDIFCPIIGTMITNGADDYACFIAMRHGVQYGGPDFRLASTYPGGLKTIKAASRVYDSKKHVIEGDTKLYRHEFEALRNLMEKEEARNSMAENKDVAFDEAHCISPPSPRPSVDDPNETQADEKGRCIIS